MNPNCGCIDKVVTINDIVHTLSYSSAVAFLSVGRILLEINSLIYTQNKIICFIVKYNKRHYKIFCVNGNTGFRNESRIFNFIHLQNEDISVH